MSKIENKDDWHKELAIKRGEIDDRYRATGRTTRWLDENIQKLFNNIGEFVFVTDHHNPDSNKSKRFMINLIKRRVKSEHPMYNVIVNDELMVKIEQPFPSQTKIENNLTK